MKPQFNEVRDRLHYVGMKQPDYDLSRFPDFLIVGPQRTGTTWLHKCLMDHPQVYMPAEKELHYFSNLEDPESHPTHLLPVDRDLGWYLAHFDIPAPRRARRNARTNELFGRNFEPRIFGEATATYAAGLHEGMIGEILLLNPDIKIMTMVRNPIDRAWSHAKKGLTRQRAFRDIADQEWSEFFHRSYQLSCGRYSLFLPRWRKLVPERNLFVGRFKDVAGDPVGLLTEAYTFLGIDADDGLIPPAAKQMVDSTGSPEIPQHLRAQLDALFGDEVESLRQLDLI